MSFSYHPCLYKNRTLDNYSPTQWLPGHFHQGKGGRNMKQSTFPANPLAYCTERQFYLHTVRGSNEADMKISFCGYTIKVVIITACKRGQLWSITYPLLWKSYGKIIVPCHTIDNKLGWQQMPPWWLRRLGKFTPCHFRATPMRHSTWDSETFVTSRNSSRMTSCHMTRG